MKMQREFLTVPLKIGGGGEKLRSVALLTFVMNSCSVFRRLTRWEAVEG